MVADLSSTNKPSFGFGRGVQVMFRDFGHFFRQLLYIKNFEDNNGVRQRDWANEGLLPKASI